MKKRWLIPLIILIALSPMLLTAGIFGFIACQMSSHIDSVPSPCAPQITYAEFPFTLVYERGGEETVINDTLICEYKGDEWNDGSGKKYRKWDSSYSSGRNELVLFQESDDEYVAFSDGYSAEYLMGDTGHYRYECSKNSSAYLVRKIGFSGTSTSALSEDRLYDEYGVRIISFEWHASPIENSFDQAEQHS